ncbi:hypothetical protein HAX54_051990 [Datura stramonium]|uniref:Uncharacterized protein n=1 Tax=Datura stramonium TaxID=4076 RepID=A0ABS8SYE3_DATST|nr:hypothetical protein [Datura stramonium]
MMNCRGEGAVPRMINTSPETEVRRALQVQLALRFCWRYSSPVGFAPGRVGSGSMLNSVGWNLWDNESLNYGTSSANSTDFVGSGN